MNINCKKYNEQDCATKNANCLWVKGQGCNRRPGVKAGKRYRYTPRGVEKVKQLNIQKNTIDRYGNINPKELIASFDFHNKLVYPKNISLKRELFDILITGLNYSVYDPESDLNINSKEFVYFYVQFIFALPVKTRFYEFCYIRFLQFMETTVAHCKNVKTIYIGQYVDKIKKVYKSYNTPIKYFTEMVKQCGQTTENVLVPLAIMENEHVSHRNTLVVTPDRKVYRVEMNHRDNDNTHTLLVNYFKDSGFSFEGFYPDNSSCHLHDGLCNFLALLVYFVKNPTPEQTKEYFVKYALWEYKAMFKQEYIEKKIYVAKAFDFYRFNFNSKERGEKSMKSIHFIKVNGNPIRLYELEQEVQKVDLVDITYKLSTTVEQDEFVDYIDRSFSYRNKITFTKNKRQQNLFGKQQKFVVILKEIKYLKS